MLDLDDYDVEEASHRAAIVTVIDNLNKLMLEVPPIKRQATGILHPSLWHKLWHTCWNPINTGRDNARDAIVIASDRLCLNDSDLLLEDRNKLCARLNRKFEIEIDRRTTRRIWKVTEKREDMISGVVHPLVLRDLSWTLESLPHVRNPVNVFK
jgi:hypothetical protein